MTPGAILFHRNFVFPDGASADKYLVILAATPQVLLAAKTTSKGSRYRNDHGCQAGSYFAAFLLTSGCCCLPKNTWVCLDEYYELPIPLVQSKVVSGDINQYGLLPSELTRDIQACAVTTDDISASQEALIRAHI